MKVNNVLAKILENIDVTTNETVELNGIMVKLMVSENDRSIKISAYNVETKEFYVVLEVNKYLKF